VDYPKRLIEVDLPIKRISAHARREKSIRHGHISSLHIWWARRPLAACRAVICAALWPDPADEKCPSAFREEARRLMTDWAKNHLDLTSPESMSRFNRVKNDPSVLLDNGELRKSLLDFISDFANVQRATDRTYLAVSRALTKGAHHALDSAEQGLPLIVDPFAGGGAIPLEAVRVGADAFASDLNPVAVLLNKVVLEVVPRFREQLPALVEKWGGWIRDRLQSQLAAYYPQDRDGAKPIAYLWARTVRCEGAGCGAQLPLMRSPYLAKKGSRSFAVQFAPLAGSKTVAVTIVEKRGGKWFRQGDSNAKEVAAPSTGTVRKGSATCPCCGYTTPVARVREQLRSQRGGANSATLIAVAVVRQGQAGRTYRAATTADLAAVSAAAKALEQLEKNHDGPLSLVPDEEFSGCEPRRIPVPQYGISGFRDLFSARQLLAMVTLCDLVAKLPRSDFADPSLYGALRLLLALAVSKQADLTNSLCRWEPVAECPRQLFGKQAINMVWDFAEGVPTGESSGAWAIQVERMSHVLREIGNDWRLGRVENASATAHPLPDDAAEALVTDPPYYYSVPYADLSDFFYVWLRRQLKEDFPALLQTTVTPKEQECIQNLPHSEVAARQKSREFYRNSMMAALAESRRVVKPSGIGVVVFAHSETAAWESLLDALISAGWVVTASWPLDTEMASRIVAQRQVVLASSVHLVCRPREDAQGVVVETVGDWRTVLAELPKRIHEWMPRLAEEGVVGADAIFACLGPALEIFSRYSRVEKASGEVVTLREYLEQVWAAVSTEALSMIFRDADAAGLESDARFTAIVLWTLGSAGSSGGESSDNESEEVDEDDDELSRGKVAKGGYTLEYDAARKIAQGLGVNLEQIDSVVEVKGDKARLRPVSERAASLFGKAEKTEAATKKRGRKATQKNLFDKEAEEGGGTADTVTIGEGAAATPGITALDRVHQAMLLFASGRADALKRFIVEDGVGGDARFWKLAQSLSALYPAGSDEKRWVDGILARKKSFGF
jgi:putative DNA methylase